jgi:hypothetical protein
MSAGGWAMLAAMALAVAALGFVVYSMVRSIQVQRNRGESLWRQFGLGIALMILFFVTWIAQGISQWQTYTDEQREHGEAVTAGDFISQFSTSTLENWQSEFLQLFAFVSLAALYVHKGSAESKDSDEKVEASLHRIEEHLGTLPTDELPPDAEEWELPEPSHSSNGGAKTGQSS